MLTQEELKERLSYDGTSGIFTWKISPNGRMKIGDIAGCKYGNYIQIRIKNKAYYAHRLVWLYLYGEFPCEIIDHIDGDKYNNKIENIRLATHRSNSFNTSINKTNASGFKGVSWSSGNLKWLAAIRENGKKVYLGYFDTPEEASEAYNNYAKMLHKEFYKNTVILITQPSQTILES